MSGLLDRFESNGAHVGIRPLIWPQLGTAPIDNAMTVWSAATATGGTQAARLAGRIIIYYQIVDLVFIVAYTLLFAGLFLRAAAYRKAHTGWTGQPWHIVVVFAPALFDCLENGLSLQIGQLVYRQRGASEGLSQFLLGVTWAKWLSVLFFAIVCLTFLLRTPVSGTAPEPEGAAGAATTALRRVAVQTNVRVAQPWPRLWRRLKVQITVVAALTAFIALPLGGPLDQVQDTIRTMADSQPLRSLFLTLALPSLLLLCASLWVIGRLALLDTPATDRRPARSTLTIVLFAGGLALLVYALRELIHWRTGVRLTWAGLALPAVLGVIAFFSALAGKAPLTGQQGPPASAATLIDKPADRAAVRAASALLAVTPVAIAGVGLVRAFLGPLLVTGENLFTYWLFLSLGVAMALLSWPLGTAVIAGIERVIYDKDTAAHAQAARSRTYAVLLVTTVITALAGYLVARYPFTWAPSFRVVGLLTLFLSAVTLLAGTAQWRNELRTPLGLFRQLGFARTPILTLSIITLLLAGQLGKNSHYHDVRLSAAAAPAPTTSLKDYLAAWAEGAAGCAGTRTTAGRKSIPMILAAAPGGGIRAAFWTGSVLDVLARTPCGERAVFAISSVSGSSLGVAVHYSGSQSGEPQSSTLSSLAEQNRLSAEVAGMAFRDIPASILGLSRGWDDRAGVFERSWERAAPALSTATLSALTPGKQANGAWRPLLMLNGTEVRTGCRILVSPLLIAASRDVGAPASCRGLHTASGTTFIPGALDARSYTDNADCTMPARDLLASTAAHLSARFPVVSPTGRMHRCSDGARLIDTDGGASENSGIDSLLRLWAQLEPLVAAHNALAIGNPTPQGGSGLVIVPMFVLIDNHYTSTAAAAQSNVPLEVLAPLRVRHAQETNVGQGVLTQAAQVTFNGNVPGTEVKSSRFYLVAPYQKPTVAAPLGWTLSAITQRELRDQLTDAAVCATSTDRLATFGCLLNYLKS